MGRLWGRLAVRGSLAAVTVVCGFALSQSIASGAGSCPGRPQLTCSQRAALYNDSVNWGLEGFAGVDLFEAPRTLHLNNPALAQFWRFEAATGITRYMFGLAVGSQGNDLSFETVPQAARLQAPVIRPSGIVGRRLAAALGGLLGVEEQEIANLEAMDIALNRATGATIDGRKDWAGYQVYVAARFARRAAGAMNRLVSRQRAVTKALQRAGLHFGVGEADQRAAQRYVRKHGWPPAINQDMLALGMNSVTLSLAKNAFVHVNAGSATFSLSQYMSSASVIGEQKSCARALLQFAAQTPAVPVPS
jgi:hypothetical protein